MKDARRIAGIVIPLVCVVAGYFLWPRHYQVAVTASTAPEVIIGQYIEAANRHACADAESLLAPGAKYSFCKPPWEKHFVRSYTIREGVPGRADETNQLRGWKETIVISVSMDIDRGQILPAGPSGRETKHFALGRNSSDEPWKIIQIGFI